MGRGQRDWLQWLGEDVIAHRTDHQKGGLDEVSIANLAGKGADFQNSDRVKTEEAAERVAVPTAGDIFFASDSKVLSFGYEASPGAWYDIGPVDETDTDTEKNKLVSNNQAKAWTAAIDAVPTGLIAMWSGTLANIPDGWLLCDGGGGRPDLREKFVRGAPAATNPGGTGGAATHSHGVGSYAGPSHTHTGPSHTHGAGTYEAETNPQTTNCAQDGEEVLQQIDHPADVSGTSAAGGTENTGAGGTGAITGTSESVSSLPPYYDIAFIIKT